MKKILIDEDITSSPTLDMHPFFSLAYEKKEFHTQHGWSGRFRGSNSHNLMF